MITALNELKLIDLSETVLELKSEVKLWKRLQDNPFKPGLELRNFKTAEHHYNGDKSTTSTESVTSSKQGSGHVCYSSQAKKVTKEKKDIR